jgi:lipopolysaccharide export system permease protein
MNTLDRYLFRTVLAYTAMAMAVLISLGAVFLFISEQSDIGVGSYSAADAVLYTLLSLPTQTFELLPIGAMIGALMGLGNLAAGSELVVTRASGVSIWRIGWPVGLAGLCIALLMYGIGEYAAPPMAQFAKRLKTSSKLEDVSFAGRSGAWVKDGNLILRVQTGEVDQAFAGVILYELGEGARLRMVEGAASISVAKPGLWQLHDVLSTRFGADHIDFARTAEQSMNSSVNPAFLGLAATDPELLTLRGLAAYVEHLRRNHLETTVFEIAFWSRIARMFAVIVVTLLALPFVFGPLRTTGAGTRTVIGVLLGVVFFLITRTVENGGQLFGLDPVLIGWLPTAAIALCTLVAIGRTR